MLNIVGKRGWYFIISAIIILPGLISLIIPPGWSTLNSGLNPGIDFTSGSVMDVTFDRPVNQSQIKARMDALGHPEELIQSTGSRAARGSTDNHRPAAAPAAGPAAGLDSETHGGTEADHRGTGIPEHPTRGDDR